MKLVKKNIFSFLLLTITVLPVQSIASDAIETAGDILQIAIPATGYAATFYLDDKEGRSQFYKSFATNLGVTFALKYSINDTRPNGGDYSFPSGHTSNAFMGAAFIHKRYGLKYGAIAYLCAIFVAYSRVESKNHYTRDVAAGAAIGMASSFYFTNTYEGFSIKPTVNRGVYGIQISKAF